MPLLVSTRRASGPHAPARDRFLDTIRTLALVRVVCWHTLGLPLLTYVVAAVPTMVFVTGSLLAKSLDRRPARVVLVERARRILLPLWAFGTVAFASMSVAFNVDPNPTTAFRWRSIVFWIVPLGDPTGSAWEGGWMSQPLWYVRAMFWMLALSPLLRAAQRRFGARMLLVPFAALVVLEVVQRRGVAISAAPELLWQLGDLALYSMFLVAGFAHHDGRFDHLDARGWLRGAAIAGGAATAWVLTQPVPLGVVNNSHPAHLLVGATWLCLLFAARRPIERLAARGAVRLFVDTVAQRTMTIYLWHSTAVIVTYQLLAPHRELPGFLHAVAMLAGTAAVTSCLVLVAGWVEDIAARRSPRLWPLGTPPRVATTVTTIARRAAAASATARAAARPPAGTRWLGGPDRPRHRVVGTQALAGVVVLALAASTAGPVHRSLTDDSGTEVAEPKSSRRPPVPSQGPPRPVFVADAPGDAVVAAAAFGADRARNAETTPEVDAVTADALSRALDDWRVRYHVPGVTVGVLLPGVGVWYGASGTNPNLRANSTTEDRFDIASITKTFTAALVYQLVDEGVIDLDAPVPPLARVPAFPLDAGITIRQLLEHRSGIFPYRATERFASDPATNSDPAAALDAALRSPFLFTPGEGSSYSSTNYLVLGFLLEQVTGTSYDELLRRRLLDPLGLDDVVHLPPGPLAPNFATSGIVANTAELLQWAIALYRDGKVVTPSALLEIHDIDPVSGLGPGVYGYCPCTIDDLGVTRWRWLGHSGSDTQFNYSDVDDVAVVIHVTDSLWADGRPPAIAELLELLRVRILELDPPDVLAAFTDDEARGD